MFGKLSRTASRGALALAVVCLGLAGCGGPVATVTGTVTYEGRPVDNGLITFSTTQGKSQVFTASISGGKYTLEKIPPGKYSVAVAETGGATAGAGSYEDYAKYQKERSKNYTKMGKEVTKNASGDIPAEASKDQTADITSGQNTKDFALTKPPEAKHGKK